MAARHPHRPLADTLRAIAPALLLLASSPALHAQSSLAEASKLEQQKDYTAARRVLEQAVGRDDNDADAHHHLARLILDHFREDLNEAEEHAERAVELADGNAEYHFILGAIYGTIAQTSGLLKQMRYAGKIKAEFVRAVELDGNVARYRDGLMRYFLNAPGIAGGSIAKATEQANAISRLDPYEGQMAHVTIALHEKDDARAEQYLKRAAAIAPARPRTYHLYGYLLLRQKRIDEAVAQFRLYTRHAPSDPNSYDSLAEALLAQGKTDEALDQYAKALSLDPAFAASLYGTARCYEAKGMRADAIAFYRKYLDREPQGENAETARTRLEELVR